MYTNSQRLLLQLVACGIGNIQTVEIPADVNLQELRQLSIKQNIHNIALDGLNKGGHKQREWTQPETDVLMDWLWQTNVSETHYEHYRQTISKLASLFHTHNLRMMLLKGYGCSLNYPIPNHRPCGDIDIWMFGKREEADRIVANSFSVNIAFGNEHHSKFSIGKMLVENHETILDINTHKSSQYLNNILEKMAEESIPRDIDGTTFYIPSVKFNSIHLLRHMASDFATVNISLRHVLDWSTFIFANASAIDWNYIHEIANRTNMNRFLDAINSICVHYLKYPSECFPVQRWDDKLRDRVLNEILCNEDTDERHITHLTFSEKIRYGIRKTARLWRNRWKYRIVYDENLLFSFVTLSKNRLTH